jgi:hypothetical protein
MRADSSLPYGQLWMHISFVRHAFIAGAAR